MKKRSSKQVRIFQALTIIRRGRLSKTHLADPKDGLSIEDKKAQETPVKVALIQVAELDLITGKELGSVEDAGEESLNKESATSSGSEKLEEDKEDDCFSRPDDVDGNVAE